MSAHLPTRDTATAAPAPTPAAAEHLDMSSLGYFESDDEDAAAAASANRTPPRRLLRAEAILARRTARLLLVVETLCDENNHQAILRTAESFGVQNVWVVKSGIDAKRRHRARNQMRPNVLALQAQAAVHQAIGAVDSEQHSMDAAGSISMAAGRWLSLRYFDSTTDCIAALRADGREIWVSSLRPGSRKLDGDFLQRGGRIPSKLAIVLGREIDGVSPEMTAAASLCVYLPMFGFSESFNVSVAAALLCQRICDLIAAETGGRFIGDLSSEEKHKLRAAWYSYLCVSTPAMVDEYMNFWLPRAGEVEAASARMVQEEEAAESAARAALPADAADASASPATQLAGMSALLRPPEESRIPKVNRRVRLRMVKEGQRVVQLPQEIAAEHEDARAAASVLAASASALNSNS
jgi:tRNA G18 (ribose-2'-O)-methylase SpoU